LNSFSRYGPCHISTSLNHDRQAAAMLPIMTAVAVL